MLDDAQAVGPVITWAHFALSASLGVLVAASEIAFRYKDAPIAALKYWPSMVYMTVNVGLAAFALWVVSDSVEPSKLSESPLWYAIGAGLGALLLIRAKVITVRIGEQDVSIGPGMLVDRILRTVDREIDRMRTTRRIELVRKHLAGRAFADAKSNVNSMVGAMASLSAEERELIGRRLGEIEGSQMSDQDKTHHAGYLILDFAGEQNLLKLFDT